MSWYIKEEGNNDRIHSLVLRLMEKAVEKGENLSGFIAKYIYRNLKLCTCLAGYIEEDPSAIILFKDNEIKFLFADEHSFQNELAFSLAEHAFQEITIKRKSKFIFSDYQKLKEITGQDFLTPFLKEKGFKALTIIRMSVKTDSPDFSYHIPADGKTNLPSFKLSGWKEKLHKNDTISILLENPSPLFATLVPEKSPEALKWLEEYVFFDDMGNTNEFPPEFSSAVHYGNELAGALLCSEKGWINQIAVDNQHRKKGLARTMFQRAVRAVRTIGTNSLSLYVYEENKTALDWYERIGFIPEEKFDVLAWRQL